MDRELKFQFVNFAPRKGVKPVADNIIRELSAILPVGAQGKAVAKYDEVGFQFSIVISVNNAVVSCDSYVTKKTAASRRRLWQIDLLNDLASDIIRQISNWQLKVNFIEMEERFEDFGEEITRMLELEEAEDRGEFS